MFLSRRGYRQVSRFLGYELARNIALNVKVKLKNLQWNKAGTGPVF